MEIIRYCPKCGSGLQILTGYACCRRCRKKYAYYRINGNTVLEEISEIPELPEGGK